MNLKDLLSLGGHDTEPLVSKLAGATRIERVPTDEAMKLAALGDYLADHIKIADAVEVPTDNPNDVPKAMPQLGYSIPVPEEGAPIKDPLDTTSAGNEVATNEEQAPGSKKTAQILRIYKIIKEAQQNQQTQEPDRTVSGTGDGVQQLNGVADQLASISGAMKMTPDQAAEPQKQEAEEETGDADDIVGDLAQTMLNNAKQGEFVDAAELSDIRSLLTKVAETGCTCDGAGTCAYCRLKQAMVGKTVGGNYGEAVDEDGASPDASTLSIGI